MQLAFGLAPILLPCKLKGMSEHASPGWWKWVVGLLLVGGIAAGAYFYFQSNAKPDTQYQTAVVSREN